jgi:hypothetical protein
LRGISPRVQDGCWGIELCPKHATLLRGDYEQINENE